MRVSSSVGGALERRVGLPSVSPSRAGSRDAPVDQPRAARELGADLAHAVAEADHVVEALAGELARGAWSAGPRCRCRARASRAPRWGAAAWGGCRRWPLDRAAGQLLDQRLGHLRARAVAGAQEQHPRARAGRGAAGPRSMSAGPAAGRDAARRRVAASNSPQRARSRRSRCRGRRPSCAAPTPGRGPAAGPGGRRPGSAARPISAHSSRTCRSLRASSISSRQRSG